MVDTKLDFFPNSKFEIERDWAGIKRQGMYALTLYIRYRLSD